MTQVSLIKSKSQRPKINVQPKLSINTPGDKYEQEADAMADRVMRMSTNENKNKPVTGIIGTSVQRKCASWEEEEKKKPIMRKSENTNTGMQVSQSFISSLNASKGGGSPLPMGTRSFMENAFSTDFSGVRIHTDIKASEMGKRINAKAFTHGNDIYFSRGQFEPENTKGRKLLIHELTHTIQQKCENQLQLQPGYNYKTIVVKVENGQTLYTIAYEHGIEVGELMRLNGLNSINAVIEGKELTVPEKKTKPDPIYGHFYRPQWGDQSVTKADLYKSIPYTDPVSGTSYSCSVKDTFYGVWVNNQIEIAYRESHLKGYYKDGRPKASVIPVNIPFGYMRVIFSADEWNKMNILEKVKAYDNHPSWGLEDDLKGKGNTMKLKAELERRVKVFKLDNTTTIEDLEKIYMQDGFLPIQVKDTPFGKWFEKDTVSQNSKFGFKHIPPGPLAQLGNNASAVEIWNKFNIKQKVEYYDTFVNPVKIPFKLDSSNSKIYRKGEGQAEVTPEFHVKLDRKNSDGRSLDDSIRSEMESKIGYDFKNVRVHIGCESNRMNEIINAKAFTYKQDVFFKNGEYNPSSNQGKELLAHELVHTRQQFNGIQRKKNTVQRLDYEGPDVEKTDALMKYLEKLNTENKIQNNNDGKMNARYAIAEWKLGHSQAILNIRMKKLIILELLEGVPNETDWNLILDLIENSEVIHTRELIAILPERIKSLAVNATNTVLLTPKIYSRFSSISNGRAKEKINSAGTFSSDKIRFIIAQAYINGILYAGHAAQVDDTFNSEFGNELYEKYKTGDDGKDRNLLQCIQTMRFIVINNLFKGVNEVIDKVNEYCNNPTHNLKDYAPNPVMRNNRVVDAMDALIDTHYGKLIKTFKFKRVKQKVKMYDKLISYTNDANVPTTLKESIWGVIKEQTKNKEGWYAFGGSILDSYHSIILLVNNRPGGPFLYWIDQMDKSDQPSSEGFRESSGTIPGSRQIKKDKLDVYIEYTTNSYWLGKYSKSGVDMNDKFDLWQMNPEKK